MAISSPSEFVTKMVDAGESKIFMSTRDTVIRAYMAGAILALAAAFAVTINVQTGVPIVGARCFRSASACSICSASTCSPASSFCVRWR
jgi:formate/nitrite transporter FocA (FNT family)